VPSAEVAAVDDDFDTRDDRVVEAGARAVRITLP
jgi:hypothetical protein